MPRPLLALLLAALVLASLPLVTTAKTADTDTRPETHRVVVRGLGIGASFPAEWSVFTPLVRRPSWFDQGADIRTPVYAWSTVFATAGNGRWCDIDRYEDFPWSFAEHAAFLERWHVSGSLFGRSGGYAIVDLPAGTAYRIELDDYLKGRSSVRYLFEHVTDRILLTCTDVLGSTEDWLSIAASVVLGPRMVMARKASDRLVHDVSDRGTNEATIDPDPGGCAPGPEADTGAGLRCGRAVGRGLGGSLR
jgi:hypothetical protein